MKTIIFIVILFSACSATGFIYYTHQSIPQGTAAVIEIDITDTFPTENYVSEVIKALDLRHYPWESSQVDIIQIAQYDFQMAQSIKLPSEFVLLGNPDIRDSAISVHEKEIQHAIEQIIEKPAGLPRSSIYKGMILALNKLSASPAKRKFAVFYTDAQENTTGFSILRHADSLLVANNPERAIQLLTSIAHPANLKGIQVYFVHTPQDQLDNSRFTLMVTLLETILTRAGAEVIIAPNFNYQNN